MKQATHNPRLFFLDWLRILAFGLLVPYHVGMYYVTWGWHVKSPAASTALEPLMLMSSPWRLGLLFFIGGAALAQASTRAQAGLMRRRSARLLLPLVFGMLVIVPPQSYFEVVQKLAYPGSYFEFMQQYLQGYEGFCRMEEGRWQCLDLPTWNHLWFLPYLWGYGLIGWLLLRQAPAVLARCGQGLAALGPWGLLLGLALPLMLARQLVGLFPSTHNLSWDWYNHAQYLSLFLLGMLASHAGSAFWVRLSAVRWPALVGALAAWAVLLVYFDAYDSATPPETLRVLMRGVWGLMQWWATAAACGFAYLHLNADSAWRRRLGAAVFCVYILHQTVIVLLTQVLAPLQLAPLLEGLLLVLMTWLLCGLIYVLARRVLPAPLALFLGVDGAKTPAPQPDRAAATIAAVATVDARSPQ
ncbi:acyltransferase family protein [Roseateles sp.]|uniref:acyltransferase family protein n=1 Tax=Roseateles sp. TaxID=1971397 RepID=UPI003D108F31